MRKTLILLMVLAFASTGFAQVRGTDVYFDGPDKIVIASGGEIELQEGATFDLQDGATFTFAASAAFTLGATELFLIDGATTAQTQTAGMLDLNFASITANTSALNILATTNTGTAGGTDVFAGIITVTQDDGDADAFGLKIVAAATTNAAAGSYEAMLWIDCVENTAGTCLDGIRIESSGVNAGMTDAIDVSDSEITNAINTGDNIVLLAAGDINANSLTVDTTDDMTFTVTSAAGEDFTIDQNMAAGAADASILISTEGNGTDAISLSTLTNGGDIVISSNDNIDILVGTTDGVLNVANGAFANDINIGNATGATDVDITAGTGGVTIASTSTGDITLTSTDDFTASASGAVALFSDSVQQTITIGNETSASSLALKAGTGNISIDGVAATTITVGDAAQTGTMSFGNSTANAQVDIGAGIGVHTINIGTGGTGANVMAIGGGTGTLAIDTADWDISTTGAITGAGNITSDGTITDGTWAVTAGTHSGIADLGSVTTADINAGTFDGIVGGTTPAAGSFTTVTGTGDVALSGANTDVTLAADSTGGNAGAKNEIIGLPRIKNVGIGTMANGSTNTRIVDIGDSETPATDWTAVDASTTMSNDSTYYRQGTASLKMAILGTATEDDGCTNTLASGDIDLTDDEGFGFWMYSDSTMPTGTELQVVLSDSVAADVKFAIPAYATANVWQWMEVDMTTANTNKDVVEDISITLAAAGETKAGVGAWNVYFDFVVIWDVAEEETVGADIPYDGVLSLSVIDATSGSASLANITEYTDYFVHYQTGNDAVVMITDQSNADKVGLALVAY